MLLIAYVDSNRYVIHHPTCWWRIMNIVISWEKKTSFEYDVITMTINAHSHSCCNHTFVNLASITWIICTDSNIESQNFWTDNESPSLTKPNLKNIAKCHTHRKILKHFKFKRFNFYSIFQFLEGSASTKPLIDRKYQTLINKKLVSSQQLLLLLFSVHFNLPHLILKRLITEKDTKKAREKPKSVVKIIFLSSIF